MFQGDRRGCLGSKISKKKIEEQTYPSTKECPRDCISALVQLCPAARCAQQGSWKGAQVRWGRRRSFSHFYSKELKLSSFSSPPSFTCTWNCSSVLDATNRSESARRAEFGTTLNNSDSNWLFPHATASKDTSIYIFYSANPQLWALSVTACLHSTLCCQPGAHCCALPQVLPWHRSPCATAPTSPTVQGGTDCIGKIVLPNMVCLPNSLTYLVWNRLY